MQLMLPASKSRAGHRTNACEASDCARAMLDGLPQVMWFIRHQMRQHRTAGLSIPQFRALCLLDRMPTASLSFVAENLGCSQPAASRLITGLVCRGFVARKESEQDRRQIKLVLTPRGRSILATAQGATQDQLSEAIAHLPSDQRGTISSAMGILREVFGSVAK